jgi:hypothetical protein
MSVTSRVRRAVARRGAAGALRAAFREAVDRVSLSYPYARLFRARRSFSAGGERYRYLVRRYNSTWRSERTVEVPIVWGFVRATAPGRVLEVGNVLSHYYPVTHTRLDKYEPGPGVVNQDIVDYDGGPFDLVVSISTLEHVGFDEEPQEPAKVLRALDRLKALTAVGGRLVVTLPIAYNPHVDAHLREGRITFDRWICLKRVSRDNLWAETSREDALAARFDEPYRRINAVVVGLNERR